MKNYVSFIALCLIASAILISCSKEEMQESRVVPLGYSIASSNVFAYTPARSIESGCAEGFSLCSIALQPSFNPVVYQVMIHSPFNCSGNEWIMLVEFKEVVPHSGNTLEVNRFIELNQQISWELGYDKITILPGSYKVHYPGPTAEVSHVFVNVIKPDEGR